MEKIFGNREEADEYTKKVLKAYGYKPEIFSVTRGGVKKFVVITAKHKRIL